MLKKQVWMADDDEFDHIVKNSNRVPKLTNAEEFTKGCNVMFVYGTYILEGEADAKFSLGDIWNLFQGDTLPNNASNFCRQMINCTMVWNYLQKTSDLPLSTEVIRQANGLMMEDEKNVLAGEYRKSPVFAGYHIFALPDYIERYMEGTVFRFHEIYLFGNIINIHPFEDGNGRTCCLILARVLIQMKCCLFPVILSSFHRRDKRHYMPNADTKNLVGTYPQIKNDLTGAPSLIKMSLSVQRSVVESFKFNGKHVRSVYVKDVGQCLVLKDVYEAIGYEKEDRVKAIQRLAPEKYKI